MFKEARIKLTAWYLLIIMVISISFSGVIFGIMSREIERFIHAPRFRAEEISREDQEALLTESRNKLIVYFAQINGIIFLVSGTLGYVLAGKTLSPIQKMLEEQKRFVSDASHELRTPLTALKSMFEVGLRDKKMTLKEAKTLISEGIEESDKLKKLSDSLLELARENTEKQTTETETVRVSEAIEEAIKKIGVKAEKKNIGLSYKGNGTKIKGNKDKLSEVLVILLDNAVKYSPEGSFVRVEAREVKNSVKIKVKDQGQGISKDDLPHIFERFYRSDRARSKNEEGGYGLGLAIAKKIVEEYRGQILVKSEINKGSEFEISFPTFS